MPMDPRACPATPGIASAVLGFSRNDTTRSASPVCMMPKGFTSDSGTGMHPMVPPPPRPRDAPHGHARPALALRPDHPAVVHLVNVVAGQDEHEVGVGPLDGVDVL